MFKKAHKSISLLLITILILPLMLFAPKIDSYAWEAHLNENDDIEIYTADKIRTSKIWYYTTGITITRCQYDPTTRKVHESGDWFDIPFSNPVRVNEGGQQYNTWTVTMAGVMARAGGEWAEEIQNAIEGTGPAVYLKLDCIMMTKNDNNGDITGPYFNAPGVYGGNGELTCGIRSDGKPIDQAYGWANPSGLKTHFNHYLLIGHTKEIEPFECEDEFVCHDYTVDQYAHATDCGEPDGNQPAFATSNNSEEFDLSQGIPTTEEIDNAFLADSWFGNLDVWARTVGHEYEWTMTYAWLENFGGWVNPYTGIKENADPDAPPEEREGLVWQDDYDLVSEEVELPLKTAYASFQYLADVHLYDFTNADIGNGAYAGDHIYYDDEIEVPMVCISTADYEDVGTSVGESMTEEPDWFATTEDHLEFPEEINYKTFRIIGSRGELTAAMMEDTRAIQRQISSRTWTRNDNLVIDGEEYLSNETIYGCNFFDFEPESYVECDKSSAWTLDYMRQAGELPLTETDPLDVEGEYTTEIPATVDNGQYFTTMKVVYLRTVAYMHTIKEFFVGE